MNLRLLPALFALCLWPGVATATEAAWSRLRDGGYTILIATAHAAGGTSSATAAAGDCSSGRYLSDRGRQQAQRMGARFAARAVEISKVVASDQCAALETARFVFSRNEAKTLTVPGKEPDIARSAIFDEITAFDRSGNQALILERSLVKLLTGITPRESEVVIVEPNQDTATLIVVGRIISD